MAPLIVTTDPRVEEVFDRYPDFVRPQMRALRALVLETARETGDFSALEETLKWGEPSFLAKKGSTLRMDWKAKKPDQYALYFKCTSRLVDTFKMVFNDTFTYEGSRAIVFGINDELPTAQLKACIRATLRYHRVKEHLTLGIE